MSVKLSQLGKIPYLFAIVLLLYMEYIFMNNTVQEDLSSTMLLQVLFVFISVILIFANVLAKPQQRIDVTIFLAGLLCILMIFTTVAIESSSSYNVFFAISKNMIWCLAFFIGYISSQKFKKDGSIAKMVLVLLVFLIILFFQQIENDYSVTNMDYVLTSIYYILCCVPFVFLIKNSKVKIILLFIIGLLVLFSFKRSALLVSLIVAMVLIVKAPKNLFKNRRAVIFIFLISVGFIILLFTNQSLYQSIMEIWGGRFESGNTDRLKIYQDVIHLLEDSNIFDLLFGHGYDATIADSRYNLSAHNEFLEILYNYGIFALIVFIAFIILLIKKSKILRENCNINLYNGYLCAVTIFIVASFPSHMLTYGTYFSLLSLYMGFAVGRANKTLEEGLEYEDRNINISQGV